MLAYSCSRLLWHDFLRVAVAASSFLYITASLIIRACVYLGSYCVHSIWHSVQTILGMNSGLWTDLEQDLFTLASSFFLVHTKDSFI